MSVPADRLTAVDIYHYLDWLAEAFADGDQLVEVEEFQNGRRRLRVVFQIDRQLARLESVLAHVGEPWHSQATELVDELKRARMRENPDTAGTFALLRTVISEWDRRPRKTHHDREVA